MLRSIRHHLIMVLARASSIGARRALGMVAKRLGVFARLIDENTEFTREIAASARRNQQEILAEQRTIVARLDRIEQLLEVIAHAAAQPETQSAGSARTRPSFVPLPVAATGLPRRD